MERAYRGLFWEDFKPGREFLSAGRTITESDTTLFAGLSGDYNPLHVDEEYASRSPHKKRLAHGALVQSVLTGLIAQLGIFEGTTVALRRLDSTFKRPVFFNDTLFASITVEETKELRGQQHGLVIFKTCLTNQDDQIVVKGSWSLVLQRKPD